MAGKRISLNETKTEAFNELKAKIRESAEARAKGNAKLVEKIETRILELNEILENNTRQSRNKLDKTPAEALTMKPEEGQAIVVVKTYKGTQCFRVSLAKTAQHKRITVAIKEIWPHPDKDAAKKKSA